MKFETSNVRSFEKVSSESVKYKLHSGGVQEVRRDVAGTEPADDRTIL
jgi:hypothetical protein